MRYSDDGPRLDRHVVVWRSFLGSGSDPILIVGVLNTLFCWDNGHE